MSEIDPRLLGHVPCSRLDWPVDLLRDAKVVDQYALSRGPIVGALGHVTCVHNQMVSVDHAAETVRSAGHDLPVEDAADIVLLGVSEIKVAVVDEALGVAILDDAAYAVDGVLYIFKIS